MKCIIWNLALVQLEIVLVSVQDSCMVCAQCTIGSEIVVEVLDLLGEEAQVKARFGLF
jgi:NADH:ubiquinone oxidoreductase subunit F (NADH-binding)